MERKTIEVLLETPVEDGAKGEGALLTKLVLREPRVRELRMAADAAEGKSNIALARELIAVSAGVVPSTIDKLTIADFNRATVAIAALQESPAPEAGSAAPRL